MFVTSHIESFASLPAAEAVDRIRPVMAAMMRDSLLWETHIRPLLGQPRDPDPITIVPLTTDSAVSVLLFLWSPGAATQIHDHSSWGAFGCVIGSLTEERYARLDDGTQLNVARLRKAWQWPWKPADGVSTLLPYSGGIHRVRNDSEALAISLHCYGPPGVIDGRDYDPGRDYVCDRLREVA